MIAPELVSRNQFPSHEVAAYARPSIVTGRGRLGARGGRHHQMRTRGAPIRGPPRTSVGVPRASRGSALERMTTRSLSRRGSCPTPHKAAAVGAVAPALLTRRAVRRHRFAAPVPGANARRGRHARHRGRRRPRRRDRVLGRRRMGRQGSRHSRHAADRVPDGVDLQDRDVCGDHGAGPGGPARPRRGHQRLAPVRGPYPGGAEGPDHDAPPADAHVRDPRPRERLGDALDEAHAVLPRRLPHLARALHALVLHAGRYAGTTRTTTSTAVRREPGTRTRTWQSRSPASSPSG